MSSSRHMQVAPPPNQTLYCNNLNDRLKTSELKRSLYLLMSAYGVVLDINCGKAKVTRGQAWVIFESLGGATRALRAMDGFDFYGKDMRVTFAKTTSDAVARIRGTPTSKQLKASALTPAADPAAAARAADRAGRDGELRERDESRRKTSSSSSSSSSSLSSDTAASSSSAESSSSSSSSPSSSSSSSSSPHVDLNPPNKILFVERLPEQASEMMLSVLFQRFDGFSEVRMVTGKPGLAFVEFADPFQAGAARDALQNFKVTPTNLMKISYAKLG